MSDREHYSPLWELTISRAREFIRQPEAVFWVFAFPLLLALALGFAFRQKAPDRVPVGVLAGPHANEVAAALSRSPALRVRLFPAAAADEALRTGRISLLIQAGNPVVYRYDPTRPDSRAARLEANDALQGAAGRREMRPVRDDRVSEPGSRYIDFLIPGLLGMNLMGTGMWGIGFSIVTARTQKLLKRLIATPMRKSHYLLSHMFSRFLFLVGEVAALLGFGWIAFDVAIRGSLLLLALICLLGAAEFSGLGLLVAARSETIEGVSGWMNFIMLPMWVLSGVFFSREHFPDAAQPFIRLLPLTALNDALRAVMLEGRGVSSISFELALMAAWSVVTFWAALKIFRWR
jgi:ABC-2 type transport system permease protein